MAEPKIPSNSSIGDKQTRADSPALVVAHQEENFGKAYDVRLLRRLWRFVVPYKRLFWLAMLFLPLLQLFGLAQPYLMKVAIDRYKIGRASCRERV